MKADIKKIHKVHKQFQKQDKFYGTTTMGARGQVVIPAQARKDLGLNPGDQLVVMSKFGKVLGLMKTEAMADFVKTIMKNLEGTGMEELAKKDMQRMLKRIKS
jgi:AbrB family looped-hinge helix DNA binding protein